MATVTPVRPSKIQGSRSRIERPTIHQRQTVANHHAPPVASVGTGLVASPTVTPSNVAFVAVSVLLSRTSTAFLSVPPTIPVSPPPPNNPRVAHIQRRPGHVQHARQVHLPAPA